MWGRKKEEEKPAVIEEPVALPEPVAQEPQVPIAQAPPPSDPLRFSPLKFEDLCRESKDVLGTHELFDGFRFDFTKYVGDALSISHSFGMGSAAEPASYHLGTGFASKWGVTLHGRVDTEGSVQGRLHHNFRKRLSWGLMSQANNAPHSSGIQAEGEFRGNNWNLSGRFGNPSNMGLSYTQTVTKRLTLGMDIIYAGKQGISMVNSGLRYEKGDMCVAGTLNAAQLGVAVSRKLFNQATLVTELQTTWASGALDTNYAVGADYMLRTSHLKARVDSNRKVTCYLEEMLNQHTRFSLSAELDHKKKSYKFGFGVGMAI